MILVFVLWFLFVPKSESRVYCEDKNAMPKESLGLSCPVQCSTLKAAIDGLRIRKSEKEREVPKSDEYLDTQYKRQAYRIEDEYSDSSESEVKFLKTVVHIKTTTVNDFKISLEREEQSYQSIDSDSEKSFELVLKPDNCLFQPVSGCFCKPGFVEHSGICVTPDKCPLSDNDKGYLQKINIRYTMDQGLHV